MSPKLCLGTAQFAMKYGITNNKGKVSSLEINKILKEASLNRIEYIDTAQSYSNAEEVLGRSWPETSSFKVINKLSCQAENFKKFHHENILNIWDEKFHASLKNLKLKTLEALLIHNSSNLKGKNGEILIRWMESLKKNKLVNRIGVSIYDSHELDNIPLSKIDIIQIPLSIYDQRMLSTDEIHKLSKMGKSIHIRSIFLQGLLLQEYRNWPNFISKEFKDHHRKFSEESFKMQKSNNYRILEFVSNLKDIEAILIGVTNHKEFCEIIQNWQIIESKKNDFQTFDYSKWAWNNQFELDPREWINFL